MPISGKIKRFMARPPEERSRLLRQIYRHKLGRLVFDTAGGVFNRPGSPLLLAWRPDFDHDLRRFPQFGKFYQFWKRGHAGTNGGDVVRLYLIFLNVAQVLQSGIKGDFVELGVYKGNSAKILHEFAKEYDRRLFLFDTFSGFDPRDAVGVDTQLAHQGFRDTSLNAVQAFVGSERAVYVQGFFPDSAAKTTVPDTVAILHLDCDLKEPMRAGLEMFYPRMAPGGLIMMHDYASGHWPGATEAVDRFFADKPEKPVIMPDRSGTAIVRKV
jgi:Macrocin-O-methyltransferase (TylF)